MVLGVLAIMGGGMNLQFLPGRYKWERDRKDKLSAAADARAWHEVRPRQIRGSPCRVTIFAYGRKYSLVFLT